MKDTWKKISDKERDTMTKAQFQKIKENYEMKAVSTHTVVINAFYDMNNTLVKIENLVSPATIHCGGYLKTHIINS